MKNRLFIFFLLFISCSLAAQSTDYGLHIQTFPHPSSEFTGLALEGGEPIRISGKPATMSFKLWNREENVFGAVFRIVTDRNRNIDLMYGVSENDRRFPYLVVGKQTHPLSNELKMKTWVDVSLCIDPKKEKVTITYDGTVLEVDAPQIKSTESLRIFFGICPLEKYDLNNIASVNIKDIILSVNGKNIRQWDMFRHQGDTCYDKIGRYPATVDNAVWLLDKHTIWRQIYGKSFEGQASIAFDADSAVFFITRDGRTVSTFSCRDLKERTVVSKGGEYAGSYPNSLIFLPDERKIMSYNLDQNLYSCFDFDTREWGGRIKPVMPYKEHYWNNTVAWNPQDSSIISFGGYGHYRFNNELLISYPSATGPSQQKRMILKEIDPRYSPTSALVDSVLYIFGGRGCESGKQEMQQKYYYDLYALNLNTLQLKRLWEFEGRPTDGDFIPGSSMLYDEENDCFYLFCMQQGGMLMKIGRTSPKIEMMSLPVNISQGAQYIYTNLFRSPSEEKLYALFMQKQVDEMSKVNIYELNWPPVALKDELVAEAPGGADQRNSSWIYILAALAVGCLTVILWRSRRKTAEKEVSLPAGRKEEEAPASDFDEMPLLHNYDFSKGSICFFGGFRATDKDGNDVTDLFTPTLKALVILLILHTGKDARGISGNRLIQTLWFDKTEESAKNNRNVYMSKLRSILERIGDVKILNQKGFWSISFEGGTMCDYLEAQRLFADKENQELEKTVELLLRGVMLPNVESDFVDPFKNDFSNMTIDFLIRLLKRSDLSDAFLLRIADTLFQHDFINEDALKVKCSILYKQGKKGLAKTVYDAFCKEYQSSLGTSFPVSMLDLIKD